jgi:hypothetical protein
VLLVAVPASIDDLAGPWAALPVLSLSGLKRALAGRSCRRRSPARLLAVAADDVGDVGLLRADVAGRGLDLGQRPTLSSMDAGMVTRCRWWSP